MISWCSLPSRALIGITGSERLDFLQGLCTQKLSDKDAVFSALLTPQGRFFTDFFVLNTDTSLIIDCAKVHHAPLMKILAPYAQLHGVSLHDYSARYGVCVALGAGAESFQTENSLYGGKNLGALVYTDPRHVNLGLRAWIPYSLWNDLPHPYFNPCPESDYHLHRIQLGIPEGAYDLIHQSSIILEYGYHHINAISWTKGCYMGQELMARTFHRGAVRKQMYRATLQEGAFPESGAVLFDPMDQTRMGWMGSCCGALGLMALHESIHQIMDQSRHILLCAPDQQPFSVGITAIQTPPSSIDQA